MVENLRQTKPWLHYGILAFIYSIGIITLASQPALHASQGGMVEKSMNSAAICPSLPSRKTTITFMKTGSIPDTLSVNRCDEITVVNNTGLKFKAAIGLHGRHAVYPGFTETLLKPGQAYSFRATKVGTFPIHDHNNDELQAEMIVK